MRPRLTLTVLIPLLALSGQSLAQSDDIIVTASRRAQPVNTYAGSVLVLDQARILEAAAVHPAELLNEISGVNIHRGSGQEHLTAIRSPVLTGGAGAGSFLYLEDGVPLRAAGFANVNGLFESALELAERVEVTKGPGSVLFGSNAVHGLVNVLSPEPLTDNAYGFDILGSENGYARLKLTADNSFAGGRFHLGVNLAHDPGFRSDSGFEQQKFQIRHDGSVGQWDAKTLASFQNLNQETAGFIRGAEAYKDPVISKSNPNPEAFRDGQSARLSVFLDRTFNDQTRVSFIPYVRWVDLSFLRHFVPGQALEESRHKSIGLITTVEGHKAGTNYTLGLDSELTRGSVREFQDGPRVFSFVQGEHYDYRVKAAVLSPYAQARWALGPQTELNIGLRADYTRYDYNNQINEGRFGRFLRIADRQDDFLTVSPKVGITHSMNQHVTLYGRGARGSRAPQVSDVYSLQTNQVPGEIKAETLDSLEAGLKAHLSGFRFEAATFVMRKKNFFFRNANGFNVINGKTHHKGIELDVSAPIGEKLSLSGGLTYARHTYAFTDIVRTASSSIRRGTPVDSAPKTLGYAQVSLHPTDAATLSLKMQYVGKYFTDPGNTAQYPGHEVFTARGSLDLSDTMTLYGRVDNLFNRRYADRADFSFGSERFFPGRPRTVFFGLRIAT